MAHNIQVANIEAALKLADYSSIKIAGKDVEALIRARGATVDRAVPPRAIGSR